MLRDRAGVPLGIAVLVLSLVAGACASRHYFDPSTVVDETPADFGLAYEELRFSSRDGTRLSAWFLPAVGEATATVVHFHGKADTMSGHLRFVDWLPAAGFNVFMFDYRGFGRSDGTPSPTGVHQDALAALAYVRSRAGLDPDRLLVFGQSLGGAVAISAVGRGGSTGVRAVVTESALSSYRAVVRDHIASMGAWPALTWPLAWLVTDNRYSPDKVVDRLAPIPLFVIHGSDDRGIPPYHCHRLYDRAREPKQMWIIEGGRHLDGLTNHREAYRWKLLEFFRFALGDDRRVTVRVDAEREGGSRPAVSPTT